MWGNGRESIISRWKFLVSFYVFRFINEEEKRKRMIYMREKENELFKDFMINRIKEGKLNREVEEGFEK